MADEVFEFLWDVSSAGYEWVEAIPVPDRKGDYDQYEPEIFLISATGDSIIERYSPLQDQSGLFRQFADTPPTQEGILGFARKYGRLGGDAEEGIFLPTGDPKSYVPMRGERLSTWHHQIRIMHQAINLWDLAQAGDVRGLSSFITWKGPDTVERRLEGKDIDHETIASWEISPELLHQFRPGDLIQPALVATQRMINRALRASPRLLWNHKQARLDLHIVPDSLLDALWFQFARAVDGNRSYRRCAACRTWFEISPDTARVTRIYCSNACRSKAYRKRQTEAGSLHTDGVPVEELARRLKTNTKTVVG